jgi:uncharacterized SAM-binding protein YcdF (DUF218 family)
VLVTARVFVWPPSDDVARADAVVVLSGDHGERLPRALELLRSGVTSTLVQVGEPDSPTARDLCLEHPAFEVVCLKPSPDSTRQEARAVGELARFRGWRTLIVVTSTQHVSRAGLLFRRCVDGRVATVHANPPFGRRLLADQIGREALKLGYALILDRGC